MAQIDVTKIEGYADMTPEQKVAALEGFAYEDYSAEAERYKSAASKSNSEAAEWKRKHNALLSEEEQKRIAQEEETNALRAELEALKKVNLTNELKSEFLSLGYEDALAADAAKAYVEGDRAKLFGFIKKHDEGRVKQIRSDILKDTPKPEGGKPEGAITKEALGKMSVKERYEFSIQHPDQYKEIYGGN